MSTTLMLNGLELLLQIMHDRIDAVLDVRTVNHDAKGVDARRDVLDFIVP